MLDRKLQAVAVPFFTGLTGVVVGATLISHLDDNITAKSIRIVDEDGNERVLADENGIVLSGEAKGDSLQLKAGGKPQVVFLRDGSNFLTVGELKDAAGGDGKIDGLVSYIQGAPRFVLAATTEGGYFLLDTVKTSTDISDFLDKRSRDSTYVSMSAVGESPQVSIGDSNGKSKTFVLDKAWTQKGD